MTETTSTKAAAEKSSCCAPGCCDSDPKGVPVKNEVRETVRQRYGEAAKAIAGGTKASCCGSSTATGIGGTDPITRDLYDAAQIGDVPADAVLASVGWGKP